MVAGKVGLDEDPRAVADHRGGLVGREEPLDEADRCGHSAWEVAVGDAAGDHERVVVSVIDVAERAVNGEGVTLVEVVERPDLACLRRDRLGRAAGIGDRLRRWLSSLF